MRRCILAGALLAALAAAPAHADVLTYSSSETSERLTYNDDRGASSRVPLTVEADLAADTYVFRKDPAAAAWWSESPILPPSDDGGATRERCTFSGAWHAACEGDPALAMEPLNFVLDDRWNTVVVEGRAPVHVVFGDGRDGLRGRPGAAYAEGNRGRDLLEGGRSSDTLLGGPGADRALRGYGGEDVLDGGDGNDFIVSAEVSNEVDQVDCGPGDSDYAVVDPGDIVTNCEEVHFN